jgi:hypothetical protein
MSRGRVIGFGALGAVIALSLMLTPGFSASFLTKFKAKKLFYTKSESDSRYLTPGQGDSRYLTPGQGDSRYLTPSQGNAQYLPASGEIRLNASPLTWQKISAAPGIDVLGERPGLGGTTFGGSTMALQDVPIAIEPTLPTVWVGKPVTLVGINACYINDQAPDPTTTLDTVRVEITTNDTGSGNTGAPLLTDTTDRNDTACRDYTLPTPHVMAPGEDIALDFAIDYSSTAAFFTAGRVSFIFQI